MFTGDLTTQRIYVANLRVVLSDEAVSPVCVRAQSGEVSGRAGGEAALACDATPCDAAGRLPPDLQLRWFKGDRPVSLQVYYTG